MAQTRDFLRRYHVLSGAGTRLLTIIPRSVWRRHETSYDGTTYCVAQTRDFLRRYDVLCGADTRPCTKNSTIDAFMFVFGATPRPPSGAGSPHSRGSYITHNDAPQSVGLLWTSDQPVAETSTQQHTTLTTDRHPYPRWDSNPQSQQARDRRRTP